MSPFSLLPRHIHDALQAIEPTHDSDLTYFPCSATLTSGDVLDTVYFMPERPTMKLWEGYWQTDDAKRLIQVADELYQQGEAGMGYTIFTVVFSDGARQACVTGTGVDFIQYPPGKGPLDVTAVLPNEGRRDDSLVKAPPSHWCIYVEEPH